MSKIQEKWAGLVSLERKRGLFVGSAGNTVNAHSARGQNLFRY